MLSSWALRASPEEGILGSHSASSAQELEGWGVFQELLKPPPPPFLGDSLTTPQSSGVSTSALKSRHFCFNVAVICFCHFTSSAVLSLGILHCKITYNCCLLFFSKSLATTHTPCFFHSEPSFFHSARGRSCRSGRAEPVKS